MSSKVRLDTMKLDMKMRKIGSILQLCMFFACFQEYNATLNATSISALLKQLRTDYDKMVVPVETGEPVNVTVQLVISDLFPTKSIYNHYSADFYLKMKWYDYRLAFNKSDNEAMVPLKGNGLLWKPDVYFPKGREGKLHSIPETNEGFQFYLNGTVLHFQRIHLISLCLMELHFYPFDIQNCTLEITSFVHNRDFIRLLWDKPPIVEENGKLPMKEFNIVKYHAVEDISTAGRNGEFDSLVVQFRFYRFLAYYFLRDFFPCILIVVLSWMTFWIDYSSTPARVAMGITTVLTIVTMTNAIRNNSPPAGLFKSVDYYLLMCNLFVFAALLEYALVGLMINKSKQFKKKNAKENAKGKTNTALYNFCEMVEMNGNGVTREQPKFNRTDDVIIPDNERIDHHIDKYSRVLFPCMFAVFNIIYFLFHRLHKDTVD